MAAHSDRPRPGTLRAQIVAHVERRGPVTVQQMGALFGAGAAAHLQAAEARGWLLRLATGLYDRPREPVKQGRRRSYTLPLLRSLHARRTVGGESTATLAAEVGVPPHALLAAWRRVGLSAGEAQRVAPLDDERCRRAYLMHVGGLPWEQVATRMEWSGTVLALRRRVQRWSTRANVSMTWRGDTKAAQAQRVAKRRA